jgi:hypothetical protein
LSCVVSALVEEWSRSYTAEALKGDVESMCMLAQGHFAPDGWGCIPHDIDRGYDWLARAKQTVVDQAAADARSQGKKLCSRISQEKAEALENDIINESVFAPITTTTALELPLDDHLSCGSLASLDPGSFSCDIEGGDTNASFVDAVQLPTECNTDTDIHHGGDRSLESDSTWSNSGVHVSASAPGSRMHSLRNSISHPALSEFSKACGVEFHQSHPTNEIVNWSNLSVHKRVKGRSPMSHAELNSLYEEDVSDSDVASIDPDIKNVTSTFIPMHPHAHASAPASPIGTTSATLNFTDSPSMRDRALSESLNEEILSPLDHSCCASSAGSSLPVSRGPGSEVESPSHQEPPIEKQVMIHAHLLHPSHQQIQQDEERDESLRFMRNNTHHHSLIQPPLRHHTLSSPYTCIHMCRVMIIVKNYVCVSGWIRKGRKKW